MESNRPMKFCYTDMMCYCVDFNDDVEVSILFKVVMPENADADRILAECERIPKDGLFTYLVANYMGVVVTKVIPQLIIADEDSDLYDFYVQVYGIECNRYYEGIRRQGLFEPTITTDELMLTLNRGSFCKKIPAMYNPDSDTSYDGLYQISYSVRAAQAGMGSLGMPLAIDITINCLNYKALTEYGAYNIFQHDMIFKEIYLIIKKVVYEYSDEMIYVPVLAPKAGNTDELRKMDTRFVYRFVNINPKPRANQIRMLVVCEPSNLFGYNVRYFTYNKLVCRPIYKLNEHAFCDLVPDENALDEIGHHSAQCYESVEILQMTLGSGLNGMPLVHCMGKQVIPVEGTDWLQFVFNAVYLDWNTGHHPPEYLHSVGINPSTNTCFVIANAVGANVTYAFPYFGINVRPGAIGYVRCDATVPPMQSKLHINFKWNDTIYSVYTKIIGKYGRWIYCEIRCESRIGERIRKRQNAIRSVMDDMLFDNHPFMEWPEYDSNMEASTVEDIITFGHSVYGLFNNAMNLMICMQKSGASNIVELMALWSQFVRLPEPLNMAIRAALVARGIVVDDDTPEDEEPPKPVSETSHPSHNDIMEDLTKQTEHMTKSQAFCDRIKKLFGSGQS